GGRLRCVLPVPRRPRGASRRRRPGRGAAWWFGAGRRGDRRRAGGWGHDVLHRCAPLLPLTPRVLRRCWPPCASVASLPIPRRENSNRATLVEVRSGSTAHDGRIGCMAATILDGKQTAADIRA